jgi:hypothetical protein
MCNNCYICGKEFNDWDIDKRTLIDSPFFLDEIHLCRNCGIDLFDFFTFMKMKHSNDNKKMED